MSKIVSIINMKGGVGKTSITVALAEFLAKKWRKRVLVIDIDPQTNATVALIEQQQWKKLDDSGKTLAQLYMDFIKGSRSFDLDKSIVKSVSNIGGGINGLDLLPSSLSMIDLQDQIPLAAQIRGWISPIDILKTALEKKVHMYDYVLIDCPPNLGLITQNGLRMSRWYLIPTIPDILSTLGIPQILTRVADHAKQWNQTLVPLGIVLSKVRPINLHITMSAQLRSQSKSGKLPRVFDAQINESAQTASAMEFEASVNTLKQKYGGGRRYMRYYSFTEEFVKVCT